MRSATPVLAVILALTGGLGSARAQEPDTRAETLRREREEKSTRLQPAEPARVERLLMDLESGRLFERLLNPAEGFYPKIGNITSGSGVSVGPAYRKAGLFGGHADFGTFAAASFKKYWLVDARLEWPRLARERVSLVAHAQRSDFPDEQFFGTGPQSRRDDFVTYGLRNTVVGARAEYRPRRWLTLGGAVDRLMPGVSARAEPGEILSLFDDRQAPGLLDQPGFMRYEALAEVNDRSPRGNPRRGGRYALSFERFHDLADGRYSFDRIEADVQQYIPLLRDRRVVALRALASISETDGAAEVPFYFQRTLGGPDDLRGFHRFRFRDRNMLLLQAEYRWEIFTAVDGAIFYDAGKVASRREDLDLKDLESDYGIGFRFGTANGVFLRVEGAFGSRGGKHFILRFGHVF